MLDCMVIHLEEAFVRYDQKRQARENQELKNEEKMIKLKKKQRGELFKWLELNTELSSLRSNIKVRLMEILNTPEIFESLKKRIENIEKNQSTTTFEINWREPLAKSFDKGASSDFNRHSYYVKDHSAIKEFKWDSKSESIFRKRRKKAKVEIGKINSLDNKYADIGLQPFINNLCKKRNEHYFREELMRKLMSNEDMELDEIQYINATSKLSDMFIDKEFYQRMLKLVPRDEILRIENDLVDQIIDNYYHIKHHVEKKRSEWMVNKIQKLEMNKTKEKFEIFKLEVFKSFEKRLELKSSFKKQVELARKRIEKLINDAKGFYARPNISNDDIKVYLEFKANEKKKKKENELRSEKKPKTLFAKSQEFISRNHPKLVNSIHYGKIEYSSLLRKIRPHSKLIKEPSSDMFTMDV